MTFYFKADPKASTAAQCWADLDLHPVRPKEVGNVTTDRIIQRTSQRKDIFTGNTGNRFLELWL